MEGDWGDCELLIVDLPPGTGDVQMTLIQKWKPAGAVIVSTPQDLALIDATRAIDMFRKMDVAGDRPDREHGRLRLPALRRGLATRSAPAAPRRRRGVMGIPFLGRIPLRIAIREASDAGTPPAAGEGEEAEIFRGRCAVKLLEQAEQEAAPMPLDA